MLAPLIVVVFLVPLQSVAQLCPPTLVDGSAFALQAYDYVIIGSGPGGMTLATRLSEVPSISVAVLEAGDLHVPDQNVTTPGNEINVLLPSRSSIHAGFDSRVVFQPEYDWMRGTIPTSFTAGRSIPAPRGKLVGGSSATNGMAWSRASKEEYAAFDRLNNGTGEWTWDTLLPYWKRVENVEANTTSVPIQNQNTSEGLFGFGGPVNVSLNKVYPDSIPPFLQSIQLMDPPMALNTAPMSGNTFGAWNTFIAVDEETGKRNYPAVSYYCPNANRSNLHVLTGAQATKILFEKNSSGLTATAVDFTSQNATFRVNATKEIILSAGVINTPQILELSGVGNSRLLQSLGIDALLDLPGVGENLQEHFYIGSTWEIHSNITTLDALNDPKILLQQEDIFNSTGGGLLSATSSILGYFSHSMLFDNETVQKLRALFNKSLSKLDPSAFTPLAKAQHEIQREWLANGTVPELEMIQLNQGFVNFERTGNKSYISTNFGIQHTISRGSIHINTTDPFASPAIDARYLTTDYDVQVLVEALRWNRRLAAISPLADIIIEQTGPAPNLNTDEELIKFIRETFTVGSHIIGTAAMAPPELQGVVDTKLKVYGTNNLRIMDISVFPMELATHPQATVFAMSERLADIIKAEIQ
ncbi:hypothetical protein D9757_012344 [Collybiopsis confluens]|uniref:Alcohol oxidase n=2 Tax=Collybiopsis confluens TaxID=2823264 RepID=A0A8H5D7F5_9AGAR|nr:hypothetical protein D9757_012344 [Collybiopsis confluens]